MYNDWDRKTLIGEGGQAQVYLVKNKNDELYAMKVFKNANRKNRFKDEIFIGKNLFSLGLMVPPIIEDGIYKDQRPYFITKYYKNGNLRTALEHKVIDTNKVEFILDLCKVIRSINDCNYAHRDLKPENILLDDNLKPIICDLGLSRNLEIEGGVTATGERIGSNHYFHMSAFNTKTINRNLHSAFDGYAFGKILYEILTNSQLLGFEKIDIKNDYLLKYSSDTFLVNRIKKMINRLLDDDLEIIHEYWNRFPRELEVVFKSPSVTIDVPAVLANKLKQDINKITTTTTKQLEVTQNDFQLLIQDIDELVCNHPTIKYINNLLEEQSMSERVVVNNEINLREILEGVGVKSHYGIEPINLFGRKQRLVLKEILISSPTTENKIGISILDNNPKASIILSQIMKSREYIDVNSKSLKKIEVDPTSIDTNKMVDEISTYINSILGE